MAFHHSWLSAFENLPREGTSYVELLRVSQTTHNSSDNVTSASTLEEGVGLPFPGYLGFYWSDFDEQGLILKL